MQPNIDLASLSLLIYYAFVLPPDLIAIIPALERALKFYEAANPKAKVKEVTFGGLRQLFNYLRDEGKFPRLGVLNYSEMETKKGFVIWVTQGILSVCYTPKAQVDGWRIAYTPVREISDKNILLGGSYWKRDKEILTEDEIAFLRSLQDQHQTA
jgi:hypothetical protein